LTKRIYIFPRWVLLKQRNLFKIKRTRFLHFLSLVGRAKRGVLKFDSPSRKGFFLRNNLITRVSGVANNNVYKRRFFYDNVKKYALLRIMRSFMLKMRRKLHLLFWKKKVINKFLLQSRKRKKKNLIFFQKKSKKAKVAIRFFNKKFKKRPVLVRNVKTTIGSLGYMDWFRKDVLHKLGLQQRVVFRRFFSLIFFWLLIFLKDTFAYLQRIIWGLWFRYVYASFSFNYQGPIFYHHSFSFTLLKTHKRGLFFTHLMRVIIGTWGIRLFRSDNQRSLLPISHLFREKVALLVSSRYGLRVFNRKKKIRKIKREKKNTKEKVGV